MKNFNKAIGNQNVHVKRLKRFVVTLHDMDETDVHIDLYDHLPHYQNLINA